jgi:hypothetical protein
MTSFMGQASWAKMVLPGDKLIAVACHLTKRVNIAEELTYHSTHVGMNIEKTCSA